MPTYFQKDGDTITAVLSADKAPDVLPAGRTFVEASESEVLAYLSSFAKVDDQPSQLDQIASDLKAIRAKVGA